VSATSVVLDWDGTVTASDALHVVLEEFGDQATYEEHEARLGRELTLHEVIAGEFRTVQAPVVEVADWLCENAELRPGFAEFARAYRPRIVSGGFQELIEPLLAREGLELEVIANRLDARADGWRVLFRNHEPCPVCSEPCKRVDIADLDRFVFVGDGYSDRCVSLAAERVFARDGLASYLSAQGVAFEPFTDFYALAESLGAGGAVVRPA
jgi:2-hydroxy-3-keto-5-methylthiopentenyl-1-phosphate phosphatase